MTVAAVANPGAIDQISGVRNVKVSGSRISAHQYAVQDLERLPRAFFTRRIKPNREPLPVTRIQEVAGGRKAGVCSSLDKDPGSPGFRRVNRDPGVIKRAVIFMRSRKQHRLASRNPRWVPGQALALLEVELHYFFRLSARGCN